MSTHVLHPTIADHLIRLICSRCRMYLWDTDSPYPDGDMEAGIVIHELSHGLSTRLTGGPKNSGCLGWGEAGGMGEGWGGSFYHVLSTAGN